MNIGFVRVFITDMDRSFDFYKNVLGMKVDVVDGKHWAQFHAGHEISLGIEVCDPNHTEQGSKVVGRFVGVTFMADDIQKVYGELSSKGVEFSGKPKKQPWGGTLAHFKDPDGNVLTLMQEA